MCGEWFWGVRSLKFDLFLVFLFYVIDPCRWVGGFDILGTCFDANQLFFGSVCVVISVFG